MRELKPCPFCGGEARHNEYAIECKKCDLTIAYETPEITREYWNTRPANLVVCPTEERINQLISSDEFLFGSGNVRAKALLALLHNNSATQEKI